jgi:negative regulator of flagellin synthesis FlgM
MKIGSTDPKPSVAPAGTERKGSTPVRADPASTGKPEPSAKVELSASASVLAAAEADPAFDTAKVERIAQAIREGKFEINADAIADKLIQNAQELLARKSS